MQKLLPVSRLLLLVSRLFPLSNRACKLDFGQARQDDHNTGDIAERDFMHVVSCLY